MIDNVYPGLWVKRLGREYYVLTVARLTSTKELVVVYKRTTGGTEQFFATPQEEFCRNFEVFDKPFFQR